MSVPNLPPGSPLSHRLSFHGDGEDYLAGHQDYTDMKRVYAFSREGADEVYQPLWMPVNAVDVPPKPTNFPSFSPPTQQDGPSSPIQRQTSFSEQSPELIPSTHYPLSNSSNDLDELDELEDNYHEQLSYSLTSASSGDFPAGEAINDEVAIEDALSPSDASPSPSLGRALMGEDYFASRRLKQKKKAAMGFAELRDAIENMHEAADKENEDEMERFELETDMMTRLHDASW